MRTVSEASVKQPVSRLGSVVWAGLLSVLAGAVAYVGVALAVTLVSSHGNASAFAAGTSYVLGAFGGPIFLGVFVARRRGWSGLRAVRFAAVVSLLVHLALSPIALAAFAM